LAKDHQTGFYRSTHDERIERYPRNRQVDGFTALGMGQPGKRGFYGAIPKDQKKKSADPAPLFAA
jgi:hypothetical protein